MLRDIPAVSGIYSVSFCRGGYYLIFDSANFPGKSPDYLVTPGLGLRLMQPPLFPKLSRKVIPIADEVLA